jgi:type IV pilus assembly protein PilA
VLHKIRRRVQDEKGFTLIELLVVILIIGILAAIAIPSFLNQKSKATDASTKSMARTAQTAIETYATDNNGSYASADAAALQGIDTTIPTTGMNAVTVDSATADTYKVTSAVQGSPAHTFSISRLSDGTTIRSCTPTTTPSAGGCVNGSW